MIQRVQSIWLFLASLTLFLLLILPVITTHTATGEVWLQIGGIYSRISNVVQKTEPHTGLFGLTVALAVICLINIFNFKNRTLQKNLILLAILLILLVSGILVGYAYRLTNGLQGATVNIGAALPLLALIFCALAFRGIRKDEQLIRSADRLR